jgi:hypothetical protein
VAAAYAVVGGSPALKGVWNALPLVVGSLLCIALAALAASVWPRSGKGARFTAITIPTLIAAALTLGVANQVVIDGKVYWRGATEAVAYSTAVDLRGDLYLLQENQVFLTLSPDQGRGLIAAYRDALAQADAVAAKWNPAVTKAPDVAGFADAYVHANRAAAAQAQALRLYLDNLEVTDTARTAEIVRLYETTRTSYSQAAATLAYSLKGIGIRLPGVETQ